ncbi:uncharacterized protein EAE98_003289 [Botrytis deweyae]|uniref:Uncharacterized protein n=1 Tax=Botrytis deweyae TaxID=2478750 RepID=A0ABQ7IT69_9HELO|nr:uncharacterized protein EAE98_003289 [Botrytis deweyae]KAF7933580.1 hypothetical protein EAE98_003289 [Botrytis deweyae]
MFHLNNSTGNRRNSTHSQGGCTSWNQRLRWTTIGCILKAWLDLVPLSLIQISHEETVIAKEDPEHSVEVDEDGYMGSLVFIMSCAVCVA